MDDYVCMWNGVEDLYICDTGEKLRLNFSFCIEQLWFVLLYEKRQKRNSNAWLRWVMGEHGKMSFLAPIVGLIIKYVNTKSFEKALAKIKSEIDAGYPCMIGALDMFYLPHFEKLYHKEHIPFHYELAIGYDDEAQILYFLDCGRTDIQTIPYEELRLFDCSYPGLSKPNTVWAVRMQTNKGKYEIAKKEAFAQKKNYT